MSKGGTQCAIFYKVPFQKAFCFHFLFRNKLSDILKSRSVSLKGPIQVAARSKAWIWDRSFAGIVGSNPAGDMDVCCECWVFSV